jgi:hypothetical protein
MARFAMRDRFLKLLIFLSALLTGLTGAVAGERQVSASAHSVAQVLAVVQDAGSVAAVTTRPFMATPTRPAPIRLAELAVARASVAPARLPREAIPAKRQV